MDPLSITAGVIAVATLAAQIGSALSSLRALCKQLPGRLHALSNEVSDIEVVLHQVAKLLEDRSCSPIPPNEIDQMTLPQLLKKAATKLNELKEVIDRISAASTKNNIAIFRAKLWRKEKPRIQTLQEDIKAIKSSLNVILGASNSREMMRVRLDLENLSTVTSQSARDQFAFWDQRISRVEELLKIQSEQIQANQLTQIGPHYNMGPPPSRRRSSRSINRNNVPQMTARADAVGVRLAKYTTVCRPACLCVCHSWRRSTTPGIMDRMLGQLFVGYAGLPLVNSRCDTSTCDKSQTPHVSFEYWFPLGFYWSQIIQLHLAYQPHVGPQVSLSTLRRVPDSAQCVTFAFEGNIEGLKNLFKHGMASPRDVSSTRGYSILRWALYGQQYETCKFLLSAGADPTYRPISLNDDSPRDKSCDIILRGGLSENTTEILRCLAAGSDFVDNQNFAPIHKIVLKLSLRDLEEEILRNPDDVDITDATGRTALEWAAARGDERSVITLLSYGADPCIMDRKLNTPLTLAANQNHTTCVRLLLEAGANPDPRLPDGIKFGSPLNCAARNASDPLLIKTLLDFNADIEASNVDGVTPLQHVARSNSASHAMILLEYGAKINATSAGGWTPLTTAIVYNNHSVLQLLLDRWYEYSECPRLQGPHLLSLVAQYADLKTTSILASTNHLKLKFDKNYVLGDFSIRLRQRLDVTDKLITAFEELLSVINQGSEERMSTESLMESGLLSGWDSESNKDGTGLPDDSEGSDQSFEDAQEYPFYPVTTSVKGATM